MSGSNASLLLVDMALWSACYDVMAEYRQPAWLVCCELRVYTSIHVSKERAMLRHIRLVREDVHVVEDILT